MHQIYHKINHALPINFRESPLQGSKSFFTRKPRANALGYHPSPLQGSHSVALIDSYIVN